MYIVSTYTTGRDDLDLIPNVVLGYSDYREYAVKALIAEVVNDCSNYSFELYSNCFEETLEYDSSEDNEGNVQKFLEKMFKDDNVNSVSIKVRYCLSSGIHCGYENVYTINDLSTCINACKIIEDKEKLEEKAREAEKAEKRKNRVKKHHCTKCGAFRPETEMERESFHPAGMKPWFLSYRYYCKKCPKKVKKGLDK